MAVASRRKTLGLIDALRKQPYRYELFQAVRLLEQAAHLAGARLEPLGEDRPPGNEIVRFRAHVGLSFTPADVVAITPLEAESEASEGRHELTAAYLGIVGADGALPDHYTRLLVERARVKDHSLRDFLDLFYHRLVSLHYRAWRKYRLPQSYEHAASAEGSTNDELFTLLLRGLTGLGGDSLRERREFDDELQLYFAGHFSRQGRSAVALEQILSEHLGISCRVAQFQGQWLTVDPSEQARLQRGPLGERPIGALGVDINLGSRVWNVQSKFRVILGPMSELEFKGFLPSGDRLRALSQLVRSFVGPEFDFDVQLVLRAEEVPRCRLGARGNASRLGWNTWLHSRRPERDASDAVFTGRE